MIKWLLAIVIVILALEPNLDKTPKGYILWLNGLGKRIYIKLYHE